MIKNFFVRKEITKYRKKMFERKKDFETKKIFREKKTSTEKRNEEKNLF